MTDSLGFLIGDVARLLRRRFDARARTIGVTRPQWRMLSVLARNEGANQGTLAELLDVEPITLACMIDRLEDAGLVERRRDPADRRAWRIHLTPAAAPVVSRLRTLADQLFEDLLADVPDAERARLFATLARLRDTLSETPSLPESAHG